MQTPGIRRYFVMVKKDMCREQCKDEENFQKCVESTLDSLAAKPTCTWLEAQVPV